MNSFSEKPQTSQSEELRDEDVKSFFFFFALKRVLYKKANSKHFQTLTQCCFNYAHRSHLQPPEIFTCMTRRQNMQLFPFTIQFVKITSQISYTTCITCPLSAISTSQTNFTVPSAQWFTGIDQKQSHRFFCTQILNCTRQFLISWGSSTIAWFIQTPQQERITDIQRTLENQGVK